KAGRLPLVSVGCADASGGAERAATADANSSIHKRKVKRRRDHPAPHANHEQRGLGRERSGGITTLRDGSNPPGGPRTRARRSISRSNNREPRRRLALPGASEARR